MTVRQKKQLLSHHAFAKLRLMHAACVDGFECADKGSRMPVNRLLFVGGEGGAPGSWIRDPDTGERLPMRPGNLYFIPCNHLVEIVISPDLSFVSWQFNLDFYYGFDVFESHSHCEVLAEPGLIAEVAALMEHAAALKTLYRLNEIIYHLCGLWSHSDQLDMQERLARTHKYEVVMDYIRKCGDATTTVEMLAELNDMRKDVFSRKFTRDLGLPPKKFISDILIRKASEQLLAPDTMVKDVAKRLNFSSEYYFSHFFKRHTGQSPRAYQRYNGGN
jgi:AraC-like DNA-binding protein